MVDGPPAFDPEGEGDGEGGESGTARHEGEGPRSGPERREGDRAGAARRPPDLEGRPEPWVETRAGGLFFVNAVLVAPELVVLVPLLFGGVLRGLGLLEGPSRFIDTIPQVAAYLLPWVGWVAVVPIWTTLGNLRMADLPSWARRSLLGMLGLHLGFLAWTVWLWVAR